MHFYPIKCACLGKWGSCIIALRLLCDCKIWLTRSKSCINCIQNGTMHGVLLSWLYVVPYVTTGDDHQVTRILIYTNGLVHDGSISNAFSMEILQSCTKPWVEYWKSWLCYISILWRHRLSKITLIIFNTMILKPHLNWALCRYSTQSFRPPKQFTSLAFTADKLS